MNNFSLYLSQMMYNMLGKACRLVKNPMIRNYYEYELFFFGIFAILNTE